MLSGSGLTDFDEPFDAAEVAENLGGGASPALAYVRALGGLVDGVQGVLIDERAEALIVGAAGQCGRSLPGF